MFSQRQSLTKSTASTYHMLIASGSFSSAIRAKGMSRCTWLKRVRYSWRRLSFSFPEKRGIVRHASLGIREKKERNKTAGGDARAYEFVHI